MRCGFERMKSLWTGVFRAACVHRKRRSGCRNYRRGFRWLPAAGGRECRTGSCGRENPERSLQNGSRFDRGSPERIVPFRSATWQSAESDPADHRRCCEIYRACGIRLQSRVVAPSREPCGRMIQPGWRIRAQRAQSNAWGLAPGHRSRAVADRPVGARWPTIWPDRCGVRFWTRRRCRHPMDSWPRPRGCQRSTSSPMRLTRQHSRGSLDVNYDTLGRPRFSPCASRDAVLVLDDRGVYVNSR